MQKLVFTLFIIFLLSCSSDKRSPLPGDSNFCAAIHRNDSINLSQQLEPVAELMLNKTGVYVLEDGDGAMVSRAWLSEYAEKTIDIQ